MGEIVSFSHAHSRRAAEGGKGFELDPIGLVHMAADQPLYEANTRTKQFNTMVLARYAGVVAVVSGQRPPAEPVGLADGVRIIRDHHRQATDILVAHLPGFSALRTLHVSRFWRQITAHDAYPHNNAPADMINFALPRCEAALERHGVNNRAADQMVRYSDAANLRNYASFVLGIVQASEHIQKRIHNRQV